VPRAQGRAAQEESLDESVPRRDERGDIGDPSGVTAESGELADTLEDDESSVREPDSSTSDASPEAAEEEPQRALRQHFEAGLRHHLHGNDRRAVASFTTFLAGSATDEPSRAEALYLCAVSNLRLERFAQARELLDLLINSYPTHGRVAEGRSLRESLEGQETTFEDGASAGDHTGEAAPALEREGATEPATAEEGME